MRDVYLPEDPKPMSPWPLRRPARRGCKPRPDAWPNRGQLLVMLIGWLLAGGALGFALAMLKGG